MAKFRYKCPQCEHTVEKYVYPSSKEVFTCEKCAVELERQLPNIGSKKVTERVDPFLNINVEEDHEKNLVDRRTEHFWSVEVPRFVESGIYSMETMLENGWLVYNEKGELVLGKPVKKGR